MVKKLLTIVLLVVVFISIMPAQAASLSFQLDTDQMEMGKFALADIKYIGRVDPGEIDLSLWQDDFFIEQGDIDVEPVEDGNVQTLQSVRLYPRHTGKLTLDSIALGGSFAKPQYITVKPSVRFGVDGTPKLRKHKAKYWADEVFVIEVDVPKHLAKNAVSAKDWEQKGFTITPLASQQIEHGKHSITRLRWQLYTPVQGRHQLELPAIIQRGKGRFRYHLPTLILRVKPIPVFIPSSVTVGKPRFSSHLETAPTGEKILNITFNKTGYLPEHIAGFQALIDALQPKQIETEYHTSKGNSTRLYRLTLPDNLWGKQLSFNLSYFDTEKGQLQHEKILLPRLWTLTHKLKWLLLGLAMLLLLCLLPFAKRTIAAIAAKYRFKQSIKQSQNAHQLRAILLAQNHSKTLEHWAVSTEKTEAMQIAKQLNQLCYSHLQTSHTTLSDIKNSLLD